MKYNYWSAHKEEIYYRTEEKLKEAWVKWLRNRGIDGLEEFDNVWEEFIEDDVVKIILPSKFSMIEMEEIFEEMKEKN